MLYFLKSIRTRAAACSLVLLVACSTPTPVAPVATFAAPSATRLNPYILQAVTQLNADYGGKGYAQKAFTHDLPFGRDGVLRASGPPATMCVAAQMEVLVSALNLYAQATGDYTPFQFLPKSSWEHLHTGDFRGKFWMVKDSDSKGAADALAHFGMGAMTAFELAQPGDFINFNRVSGKGHGVIFVAFLDKNGTEIGQYGPNVAGFKYFSSQGQAVGGGLGYRYAFFDGSCPQQLNGGRKRDCGVIRSQSQRYLNVGYALLPTTWDAIVATAALAAPTEAAAEGAFDGNYFDGVTTDD